MDAKIILVFIIGLITNANSAGLLRTPKVYNAIITTDENLTPSRAFPVIQPTIHETGIATYPFGPFNPYRFYNPPIVHIPPPFIQQALFQKQQIPVPQSPPQNVEQEYNPEQRMLPPSDLEMELQEPQRNQSPPNNQVQMHDEKAPIPLNEYGLPPSLVPLQSQPPYQNPITLQPYTYNHYPLIFDTPYKKLADPYLPHYGYYPPHTYSVRPLPKTSKPSSSASSQNKKIPSPSPSLSSSSNNNETPTQNNDLDNIKNGIANKNSEVPDVPPPPLPSSAKTSN